jgi:competence ComEA-like helix-hairpin-helix protein
MRTKASILVGLLWCVALLSVVVISLLHTARMDLMVVKNYGDRIQAHYLAVAGIEKAKALLYQNARERSRSGKNHSGELYNSPEQFRDVAFGRGQFRVVRRARQDEGGGIVYGVSDEESRLNINSASTESLAKLNGMSAEIAAAINDWRDGDNAVSPGGAEAEYYLSLQPPYQPRNGPLQTLRELLMVKGISPDLLLGKDTHQNGLLDSAEDSAENSSRADDQASDVDTGWAGIMTVDSTVKNVSASGQDRVNIQNADEAALTGVHGITPDIARAITAYRGQNRFQSIADLLDVTRPQNNQNQNRPPGNSGSRQNNSTQSQSDPLSGGASGPKVIDENLFMDIADDVTADSNDAQAGAINLNTASLDVLACLPGVGRELAQAIISHRQSSGFFPNIAQLLKVPGMTRDMFKQVAPLVSARSETFRILSEGKIKSTGARQRIQVVVHIGLNDITTLSYREDDL